MAPLSIAQLKKVCKAMDLVHEAVRRSNAIAEAETAKPLGG